LQETYCYLSVVSDEELHILYLSPNINRQIKSRRMRWAGHVARIGKEGKVYKVLVENLDGKKPLGRPRRKWGDGTRMDGCRVDSVGSG
jgi:hypothetical protein